MRKPTTHSLTTVNRPGFHGGWLKLFDGYRNFFLGHLTDSLQCLTEVNKLRPHIIHALHLRCPQPPNHGSEQ